MFRLCRSDDFERILTVINAGAQVYKGSIPEDRWKDPYMPRSELQHEMESGVEFSGYESDGILNAVMGLQNVKDVTLIRHAYVEPDAQRNGIGGLLLKSIIKSCPKPILIQGCATLTRM